MLATTTEGSRAATGHERVSTIGMFLCCGLGFGSWAASLAAFKLRLGISDGLLGLALAALMAGSILGLLAAGYLAGRFGSGPVVRAAAALYGLSLFLPGLAPSLLLLIAAATVMGLVSGMLDVGMNAHASDVEGRWGSPIMSSFHAAFSLGGLLGAGLGGVLAAAHHALLTMPIAALVILAIVGTGWRHLDQGVRGAPGPVFALPERALLPLGLICLLVLLSEGAIMDWSTVFLATVVHAPLSTATLGYAGFSVAMVIGRLAGDWATRRFSARRIGAFGGSLATLGLALVVIHPTLVTAIIGFSLGGLGLSNLVPVTFGAAGKLPGIAPARGIAMVATAGYSGMLMGPPVIGGIASLGGLPLGLGFAAACVALAALLSGRAFRA